MSITNETTYLIVLDSSQNEAEKFISLLRNAGIATRAERITTEEELLDHLQNRSWDLFLAREEENEFGISEALSIITNQDRDIPFIAVTDDYDEDQVAGLLKAGAKDAIPVGREKHLAAAAKRELLGLSLRKKLRHIELQNSEIEQRSQLLLDSSKDAVAYISDGMHIYANASYMSFLGYDDIDDLICITVLDTLTSESQEAFKDYSKKFIESGADETSESLSCTSLRSDDHELPVRMSLSKATYDGEDCLQILLMPEQDNAELEEKLREISQQDLVTGLFNRQYFMEQLHSVREKALAREQTSAIYYIAIDNFSKLRTNIGIADADIMLRDLTQLLKDNADESHVIARLSDDVFGLIGTDENEDEGKEHAERIRSAVEDHLFEIEGRTFQITVSIGLTFVNDSAPVAQDILGRAHSAQQQVHNLEGHEDGNGVQVYVRKFDTSLSDDETAIELIQEALDADNFKLLYQPIISLRGESEEQYESFVRMVNDQGEEVSPYEFLPPSGPSAMASKIDRWVILQTIKQLSTHRANGHDTKLFINLTSETIQDQTFTSWLNVALQAAKLPGDSIIFQISESNAITYMKQAKEFNKGIKSLHCKLSINQFGRALNPFNLLKHIDADYIKLEGSFTEDMTKDDETKEAAKAMITELQGMEKLTIVPLVESASMLSVLWQAGVNYIQGYYLQAPSTEMNYDFSEE